MVDTAQHYTHIREYFDYNFDRYKRKHPGEVVLIIEEGRRCYERFFKSRKEMERRVPKERIMQTQFSEAFDIPKRTIERKLRLRVR